MSIFQNSVVTKQLQSQDKAKLLSGWNAFRSHFHNPTIQANIRSSKEEQYQGEFLIDLFVNVLGYTKNPTPNFTLTTEYKNVKDSKKADGAILVPSLSPSPSSSPTRGLNPLSLPLVKAVIELKGTNTTDLNKIEIQAFGYKNNQPDCVYVITSNFEKLRFYIDNATEHIEFNLFNLTEKEFELLYLCLAYENIANDIPKKLKEQSVSQEKDITKKLYIDYSNFKRELHQDLVKQNSQFDALELFQKSQKLLDRFLFIFFAEDRNLLPTNLIFRINKEWRQLQEMRMNISLYDRYKIYFSDLNKGAKVTLPAFSETIALQKEEHQIFAYNGGLFQPDEILDQLNIDDELLYKYTHKLSNYDFASEVDVNILGHIFENSLNELDELTNEVKVSTMGLSPLTSISKRKKDGVFYTPKYITKYIVDNTVGKLCEDKKAELKIVEEDYGNKVLEHLANKGLKSLAKKTKQELFEKLTTYRNWLLQITICDPACGSGAFLNQALDFLIDEHRYIDELQAKLFGDAMVLSDVEKSILENNLFGVDLNEESVEIAKLSLWLRTAQPNRKLNDLNNNIKCGNSLIEDVEIAGDKAFNWQTAFPQVFKEKQKKPWHITTAIHDSRTSQRMIDYKVREKRAMGTMSEPQINYLTDTDEMVIAETVAVLVKEQNLNILAFNVCKDHIHLVLVCEEEEVNEIVRKIKGRTAREVNKSNGINPSINKEYNKYNNGLKPIVGHTPIAGNAPIVDSTGEKSIPLWTQKFGCKEIVDEKQLTNTIDYIKTNRVKHNLPDNANKGFKPLVDSISCDFEHAFREEYKGGFDVIIGNPPYVKLETMKNVSEGLSKLGYATYEKRGDLYILFVEKGFQILKNNGKIAYIMPNKWLQAGYGKPLREFFLTQNLQRLIDFGDLQIFEGATTYPCVFFAEKNKPQNEIVISVLDSKNKMDFYSNVSLNQQVFEQSKFSGDTWVISSSDDKNLLEKLNSNNKSLKELINGQSYRGVLTGLSEAFFVNNETKNTLINEDISASDILLPFLQGRNINKWQMPNVENYLVGTFPSLKLDIENYSSVKNHLLSFGQERLEQSGSNGSRKKTSNKWFETQDAIGYWKEFSKPKIMYQKFQVKPCFIYDEQGLYCNDSMWIIPTENKALVAILNSKMGWWLISKYCTQIQNGYQLIWNYFGLIPIPDGSSSNANLVEKADLMLTLNKDLQEQSQKFQRNLQREFFSNKNDKGFKPLAKKLQDWYLLSYGVFIKELEKQKVKLSLSQKADWEEYFTTEAKKVIEIKNQIDATERAIDAMVYELYGLSEKEIDIVELN